MTDTTTGQPDVTATLQRFDTALSACQANVAGPVEQDMLDPSLRALDVQALIQAARDLRALTDRALYIRGPYDCAEGDCPHVGEDDDSAVCPLVETRIATTDDAVIRERLEEILHAWRERATRGGLGITDLVEEIDQVFGRINSYASTGEW